MNDTAPQIVSKMEEMIRQKTPSERLSMGCSMFDLSKELVRSSILKEDPRISAAYLRRQLFLRFYGDDFSSAQQQKIIGYLTKKGL